jgi:hypothetical protein
MPISPLLATRFFQLLTQRSITEAERVLEKIEEKVGKSDERGAGYMAALEGALMVLKANNDRYAFIMKVEPGDKEINKFKNEFLKYSRSEIHTAYDRGYFSAWSEYMRVLSKVEKKKEKAVKETKEKLPPEEAVTTQKEEAPKVEANIPLEEAKPPKSEGRAEANTAREKTVEMMEKQVGALKEKVAVEELQQKEKIAREDYFPKGDIKPESKTLKGNVQTRLDSIFGSNQD